MGVIFYKIIVKPISAAEMVGTAMMTPYFIKSRKVYLTFCLPIKSVNIIPAKAPIGVKNAPIFDPMIVLKIA